MFLAAQAQSGQSSGGGETASTQPLTDTAGTTSATTIASGEPTTTLTLTDTGQTVAIPDIVGLFHLTASVRLGDVAVEYQKEAVCEDENQKELVLSQTPAPGTVVEVGSTVNFTYQYSSPCGLAPDLVGLTEQEARKAWEAAGFVSQFLTFPDSQARCHDEAFGEGLVWWHTGVPGELEPLQFAHGPPPSTRVADPQVPTCHTSCVVRSPSDGHILNAGINQIAPTGLRFYDPRIRHYPTPRVGPDIVGRQEIAQRLHVQPRTLSQWKWRGILPCWRSGVGGESRR